jgi:hypothetical protein
MSLNAEKLLYTILSLFSAFLFTLVVLVVNYFSSGRDSGVLDTLNDIIVYSALTNLSSGQIIQKHLVSRRVLFFFIKLLIALALFGITLGVSQLDLFGLSGFIIAISALINLIELYNVVAVFSERPLIGSAISMSNRIMVTIMLILVHFDVMSLYLGLEVLICTLAIYALCLFINQFQHGHRGVNYSFKLFTRDILQFNLVNWPVSIAQNVIRIFLYDGFELNFKFKFEYLSKFISLIIMIFDYNIRYNIAFITKNILNNGISAALILYLKMIRPYGFILLMGILFFSIYASDVSYFLLGSYLALFNIFSFISYSQLIRNERGDSLFWAIILILTAASSAFLDFKIVILLCVIILLLAIFLQARRHVNFHGHG